MADRVKHHGEALRSVVDDIDKGRLASCYLLYGDEEYLVKDALHRIIDAILPGTERSLNLFWMEGDNASIDSICEAVLTPPLIPGRKVVAVQNTLLFSSKASLSDVIKEIVENLDNDSEKTAKAFGAFLHVTGWTLESLQEGGWRTISDEDWRKTLGADAGMDREDWLPKAINAAVKRGINVQYDVDRGDLFEKVLRGGSPEGNCLILTTAFVDKRKKIFKTIADVGKILHFSKVKGDDEQKRRWLHFAYETLEKEGKKLSSRAVSALGERTGFSMRESMQELEKIITYVGDRAVITEEDIAHITGKSKEDTLFDLTSALVNKNLEKTLSTVHDLLNHGFHHLQIVSMIAREIRLLLQGKILLRSGPLRSSFKKEMNFSNFRSVVYPDIALMSSKQGRGNKSLINQHPYVIYNALKNSEKFSYEELVGYLEYLSDIDIALKSTGKDPKLVLERLLIDMCQ